MKQINKDILRIVDANMNRAVEGIRVLEDTARMLLDDSELSISLKGIRHDLTQIIRQEKALDSKILFARGSDHDVLRSGETKSEKTRDDVVSLLRANAGRAQEAVRSMEEYIKLSFPPLSEQFKNIRFRLYDIEKCIVLRFRSRQLSDKKHLKLYVIIENDLNENKELFNITRCALNEGAGTIAYRDNVSHDHIYLTNAEGVMNICNNKKVTTIIENRLDAAMILGTDGVCLSSYSFPVKVCRNIVGEGFLIGLTIQNAGDFNKDSIDGVDYLVLESFFDGTHEVSGNVTMLEKIVSQLSIPVIVSCGVSAEYVKQILNCGVTGIAVKINSSGAGVKPGEIEKIRGIIDSYSNNYPD